MNSEKRKQIKPGIAITILMACAPTVVPGAQAADPDATSRSNVGCDLVAVPGEELDCFENSIGISMPGPSDGPDSSSAERSENPQASVSDEQTEEGRADYSSEDRIHNASGSSSGGLIEMLDAPLVADTGMVYRRSQDVFHGSTPLPFNARIRSVKIGNSGKFFIELDNGEHWREASGNRADAPRPGSLVEVYRGRSGGYRMKVEDHLGIAWVRPVRQTTGRYDQDSPRAE